MKRLKMWYLRAFKVITIEKAKELNLHHSENIYGDEINMLGCRSIWKDDKGNSYRVHELYNQTL